MKNIEHLIITKSFKSKVVLSYQMRPNKFAIAFDLLMLLPQLTMMLLLIKNSLKTKKENKAKAKEFLFSFFLKRKLYNIFLFFHIKMSNINMK